MNYFRWNIRWRQVVLVLLSGVLLPLWLSACAAQQPAEVEAEDRTAKQFMPDPDNGTVYLYRKSLLGFLGAFGEAITHSSFSLRFDGQNIGMLKSREFFRLSVPPGAHDIVVTNNAARRQARLTLDVERGRLYFVDVIPFVKPPADLNPPQLVLADEKTGKQAVLDATVVTVETGPRMLR